MSNNAKQATAWIGAVVSVILALTGLAVTMTEKVVTVLEEWRVSEAMARGRQIEMTLASIAAQNRASAVLEQLLAEVRDRKSILKSLSQQIEDSISVANTLRVEEGKLRAWHVSAIRIIAGRLGIQALPDTPDQEGQ
jgi:hypothetical protein